MVLTASGEWRRLSPPPPPAVVMAFAAAYARVRGRLGAEPIPLTPAYLYEGRRTAASATALRKKWPIGQRVDGDQDDGRVPIAGAAVRARQAEAALPASRTRSTARRIIVSDLNPALVREPEGGLPARIQLHGFSGTLDWIGHPQAAAIRRSEIP